MLNPKNPLLSWKKFTRCALAGLALACALSNPAHAWVTLDLPDLTAPDGGAGVLAYSNLPDGQLVYGNNNALYVQNNFGSAAVTSFATPPDMDPSFVTVLNATTAVFGVGEFTNSPVYQFNPSTPATPGYTSPSNNTLQNYAAAPAGTAGVYVAGQNNLDGNNSISYVTLAGSQPQQIVDSAGEFSAGLAEDSGGNLYVGDNDNNSVYKFTAAQIQNAIKTSTALTLSNGLLLHTFSNDVVGSLAVDAEGRIWAAGFGAPGLFFFNPGNGNAGVLDPEDNTDDLNGAYSVGAFSANSSNYVSFIWQSDFTSGSSVVYGYDTVQNVPEPAQSTLIAAVASMVAAVMWRKRQRGETLA